MTLRTIFSTVSLALACTITASATTVTAGTGGTTCANPAAGLCTAVAGASQIDFESATSPSPYTSGIATFSFSPADFSPFVTGSSANEYAAPPNDQTRFLSVGSPGGVSSVTIDFSAPISYYGLYFGSPDAYNLFTFFETGNLANPIASFTGDQLIPPGVGNQSIGQFVNFNITGGTVSRIVLSSSSPALESDNHAYVQAEELGQVPEPATMGLMGGALLGISLFARRRSKSKQ